MFYSKYQNSITRRLFGHFVYFRTIYFQTSSENLGNTTETTESTNKKLDIDINQLRTMTYRKDIIQGQYIYADNDIIVQNNEAIKPVREIDEILIGGYHEDKATSDNFYGKLYAFRIYNRALTTEEIKINQQIDEYRFKK